MLCPNCETDNRESAKFCDECGFPLTGAIPKSADDTFENASDGESTTSESEPAGKSSGDAAAADADGDAAAADADGDAGEGADRVDNGAFDGVGGPGNSGEVDGNGGLDSGEADIDDGVGQIADSGEAGNEGDATDGELVADVEAPLADDIEDQPTQTIQDLGNRGYSERYGEDLDTFNRDATEVIRPELIGFDTLTEELPQWRDGSTMEMPRVEGDEPQKGKVYSAQSTVEKKGHGKLIALIAAIAVIVAAIAAFGTYQAGIWGGKPVPDVSGMIEADARSVLVDEGFQVRVEQIKSDDTEGVVLIMDPSAGTRMDEGSEVVINVATARLIPDVQGMTEDEAKQALAAEGFEDVKVKKKSSDKKKGSVIGVDPKAGEKAQSTTEVTITIAQPFTVPDISKKSLDEAITAIEKASLGYEVVYYSTDDYPEGTIIGTEPVAGTEVKKGSYVVIQVAQSRSAELEELAASALAPGTTLVRNGKSYTIESLDAVSYSGGNQVQYTVTAREYGTLFGITLANEVVEQINGTVEFNDDNELVQIY